MPFFGAENPLKNASAPKKYCFDLLWCAVSVSKKAANWYWGAFFYFKSTFLFHYFHGYH